MLTKSPEIGCGVVGRVTGVEPATSRITISREFNKIKEGFRLYPEKCRRVSAGLLAAVEKNIGTSHA